MLRRALNALLYFPARAVEATPAAAGLAFRELSVATEDGEQLHAWWVPAAISSAGHVLLCHGNAGNLADRVPHVALLSAAGFDVLVFDFRGYGLSPRAPTHAAINRLNADLQGASELLRDRGAKKVFLVGESFGGSAVVGSEPRLDPAPDGVVSLGGPADLSFAGFGPDLNGLAAAREIRAPLLILAGREDGHVDVGDLRTIVRRAPTQDKRLLLYPGHYHAGALLFDAPYRARPRAALLEFLRTR
jgi:alpha-beta hydrolase superfamily lysophospholipase